MSLWLIRAGSSGEYERQFLEEGRIYFNWSNLLTDLGFGQPRLCVQVKSQDSPVERVVLDQLIGNMQNFHAEQGLLVSWSGFKQTIEKERASQFFRVRLWSRNDLIENLLAAYDKLDEDLRSAFFDRHHVTHRLCCAAIAASCPRC